jgi:transcriptional regulator of acetoin/glycerol metabolism
MQILLAYDWPGNVRELKNTLEATMINVRGQWIETTDLPEHLQPCAAESPTEEDADRRRILDVLQICQWNKAKAARQLQWSRMTLYRKLAKYQIEDFSAESVRSAKAATAIGDVAAGELFRNVS